MLADEVTNNSKKKENKCFKKCSTSVFFIYKIIFCFSDEVDSHLHLLIKEIPGFCTVHKVRSGTFLKINKNEQLTNVMDKLQAIIKQRRWFPFGNWDICATS